ncbi:hypothetical protein [Methylobacterium sp. WCS2018Hpa-22]|uniref:hypothetical protein n=1 Tax=Methylobacterium sp. WCS2018Hpa-22 TaxID=3073633 RepID=UPI0028895C0B|nr:hypothetical protein [Methylobacterium sp. WCS2018Hpa-22]
MAEATFEAYKAFAQSYLAPLVEQPYEDGAEDFRRGQSVYAGFIRAEKERHERQMDAWRAEFERGYLASTWRAMVDVVVDAEADKVARPAIGKPLSRRARRRNRGRVRAARMVLGKTCHQPVQWEWPAPRGFHG